VLDEFLNWVLDGVDAALATWPDWTPNLPALDGLVVPLEQINWLVAVEIPWQVALAMLLLGPAMLATTLTLWVIGLLTPTSTSR
jgi:hypothetical protein